MKLKGSSKKTFSFALVLLLFAFVFAKNEAMETFGKSYIIYALVVPLIILAIEMLFDKKETISCDSEKIYLDLKRYNAEFQINDIRSISLADNSNDLTIETNVSKEFFKLYGFRRKKILQFIESINNEKTI